jgi:hypothetical protein
MWNQYSLHLHSPILNTERWPSVLGRIGDEAVLLFGAPFPVPGGSTLSSFPWSSFSYGQCCFSSSWMRAPTGFLSRYRSGKRRRPEGRRGALCKWALPWWAPRPSSDGDGAWFAPGEPRSDGGGARIGASEPQYGDGGRSYCSLRSIHWGLGLPSPSSSTPATTSSSTVIALTWSICLPHLRASIPSSLYSLPRLHNGLEEWELGPRLDWWQPWEGCTMVLSPDLMGGAADSYGRAPWREDDERSQQFSIPEHMHPNVIWIYHIVGFQQAISFASKQ